jgi:hypothetical protein
MINKLIEIDGITEVTPIIHFHSTEMAIVLLHETFAKISGQP